MWEPPLARDATALLSLLRHNLYRFRPDMQADTRSTAVRVYGWEREWEEAARRWQHMANACTGGFLPKWLLRGLWDLGARAVDVAVLRAIVHDFEERIRRGQPQRLLTMFHGGANHTARIAHQLLATGWYA